MSCWKLVSFLFPSLLLLSHFRKSLVQWIVKVPPHFEDFAQKMTINRSQLHLKISYCMCLPYAENFLDLRTIGIVSFLGFVSHLWHLPLLDAPHLDHLAFVLVHMAFWNLWYHECQGSC
jgi:hypothetical protein